MTNIFVANLPRLVTEELLWDLFSEYGAVERVQIIYDSATRQSRGFAFIEMQHDRDALLAIEQLNGRDWDGRILTVRIARERLYQKA